MAGAGAGVDLKIMRAAALLDSDPASAVRLAAEILEKYPGHEAATLLLAMAHRNCGSDPQAAGVFAELADAQPHSAQVQLEVGRTHAGQGDTAAAQTALERAVELEPNLADAWRELSALYAVRGDATACDAAYQRFARLAHPEQHLGEAGSAFANRRFALADSLLQQQLEQAPRDVGALRMLAEIAAEREDYARAERLLNECLTLAPGYAAARFSLARILHSQQKAGPMVPLLERLLVQEPDSLPYRLLLASAYGLLGQNERATKIIAELTVEFPRDETVWLSYGHTLRIAGHLERAVEAYRKCVALSPQFGEAWFSLANLKIVRFTDDDVATMQRQVARTDVDDGQRLQFEFALGKAFEDARDYSVSFEHYSRGNALRRAAIYYDSSSNARFVQRTETLYTEEFFMARAGAGCPARDPIFIVGLPRSGSTLLEQILASHSQVEGTRELPDIPGFALELGALELRGKPASYPQSVALLTHDELTALGERYMAQTRPHRVGGRPRFIDKMPSNFCHVGLIQLTLPNACIIDARRSPLACCFANFKQHFQSGVWFSYSLDDIGHYYRDYVRVMAHFDSVLPGRIHRVNYEDVVADLEGEVRRLLDYCGLPFEDACLKFHETRRLVQTASSEQVRQPLYAEGVDQWRHYEKWLAPLKAVLGGLA